MKQEGWNGRVKGGDLKKNAPRLTSAVLFALSGGTFVFFSSLCHNI
jgi:hypothetical protein